MNEEFDLSKCKTFRDDVMELMYVEDVKEFINQITYDVENKNLGASLTVDEVLDIIENRAGKDLVEEDDGSP